MFTREFGRPSRRSLLLLAGTAPFAVASAGSTGRAATGALDAAELGVLPGAGGDQTSEIAAALRETVARQRPLFLGPGRYVVSGLDLPDRARLVGVPGATRLTAGGTGPVVTASGSAGLSLQDVAIEGLRLAGEEGLVLFTACEDVAIEGLELTDSDGNGIKLVGCSGRVTGCSVVGAADAGIFALDGSDLAIADNRVSDCGNNGILVWQSEAREDGATVARNRISGIRADGGGTGQNGNAINVFRAGGVGVVDNVISGCAFSAVRHNAGADIVVARNRCRDLGEVALYVEFGFEGAIVSDNLVHGAAHGISATNFADGGRMAVISGNLIRDIVIGGFPEDRGVGIGVEADAAVTGNVVDGAAFAGLSLGWGPHLRNVAATGNVIRRARYGIAVSVADGAGAAAITGNVIAEAQEAAIAGFAWHDLVEPDLAAATGDHPHLTISANDLR
ncbi:TIGR03808 family TAT-translocated repetitive protein [Lutibaculum baratangense]|nr:TIGR03808 family TAT-translocated repetitive protein [Lutibaculum baratangense]